MNDAEYEAMYRVEDSLWWYTGMRRVSEAVLGRHLRQGIRVLDAGCGTGGNVSWLSQFGTAFGIDLAPQAMRYCRERRLSTVSQASVLSLPFGDASFDLVTSFDVVYHLDVADDVAALRELRRVTRPGGAVLVRVPAVEWLRSEHDAAVHTRQRYSLRELEAKLARAGLDVERASYANALLFPLAAIARLTARWRAGGHHGDERSDVRPVSWPVNAVLRAVLNVEAWWLRHARFALGLSALALARRPEVEA